ncbi:MAG: hypothetical protein JWP91_4154 [Fibrobacteres bacterium]|nr:hypothetical protein [Fibrobacterota bacterium]
MTIHNPLPGADAPRPGPRAEKARILLPIVLAVLALAVFLILFWPSSHGKKGNARGHGGVRDESAQGNSSVTGRGASGRGGSPVGGERRARPSGSGKGDTWWYKEKGGSEGSRNDGWWYQDKGGSGTGGASGSGGSESPVGGAPPNRSQAQEAAAEKNSGPDNDWWRD